MNGETRQRSLDALREWFESLEGEKNRKLQLRAFGDFCLDFLEEKDRRMKPEKKTDHSVIKGLPSPF